MSARRRAAFVSACTLTLITVIGCASGSRGSFCEVYEPVHPTQAERDMLSPETSRMIDGNNAVWLEVCDDAD